MFIGVPKEVKNGETRVALTPAGARALVDAGHTVCVEANAGALSTFTDVDYVAAGAAVVNTAAEAWAADLVVKVKEPVPSEYSYFRKGLVLFTYLHLAPLPELTNELLVKGVTAIAYETVVDAAGTLPLLTPMSEVAGRLSVQVGASYLQHNLGGRGLLLGGVPGVPPARVCVLGGGVVGINAAKMALGLGADVTIVDSNLNRLRDLDDIFRGSVRTLASNSYNIAHATRQSELVIGGVLIAGAAAPKLLTEVMVREMLPGPVVVDVAIDQGGCFETARPTTHSDATFVLHDVVHYCVTNMPALVPNTSTLALTNATFPYLARLASMGAEESCRADAGLAKGLNTYGGVLTSEAVAVSQERPWEDVQRVLKSV